MEVDEPHVNKSNNLDNELRNQLINLLHQTKTSLESGNHPDISTILLGYEAIRVNNVSQQCDFFNSLSKSFLNRNKWESHRQHLQCKTAKDDLKQAHLEDYDKKLKTLHRSIEDLESDLVADLPISKSSSVPPVSIDPTLTDLLVTDPFFDWLHAIPEVAKSSFLLTPSELTEYFYQYKNDEHSEYKSQFHQRKLLAATQGVKIKHEVYVDPKTKELVYGPEIPIDNLKQNPDTRVLRFSVGSRLAVIDSDGYSWAAEIVHIDPVEIHVLYDQGAKARIYLEELRSQHCRLDHLQPNPV